MPSNRFLPLALAALVSTGAASIVAAADAPAAAKQVAAHAAGEHALPYALPAKLDQLRFVVEAKTADGQALDLYTGTSGPTNFNTAGADKLKLPYTKPTKPFRGIIDKVAWPAFTGGTWLPPPAADDGGTRDVPIVGTSRNAAGDGMLGVRWFAGRTIEWDYPAATMRLLPSGALPRVDASHIIPMSFRKDGKNPQATGFARIPARVDGADLQFVFDTGATFRLKTDAIARFGGTDKQRAGSFIAERHFKDWHARHPDWPYIEHGDAGKAMIQVPDVEIAGWHTGPVWFSSRPDRAFNEAIVALVDQPLDGALGGNAFATFRITADYPSSKLAFEQVAKPVR